MTTLPDDWQPTEKAAGETCPKISGWYAVTGEEAKAGAKPPSLRSWINLEPGLWSYTPPPSELRSREPTSVELLLQDEMILVVRVMIDHTAVAEARLVREDGDFSCSEGVLSLKPVFESGGAIVVGGAGSTSVTIVSAPGYLVVNRSDSGALIIPLPPFFVPVMGNEIARFPVQQPSLEELQKRQDAAKKAQQRREALLARFEHQGNSVIRDVQTGLEWTQSDNGSDIDWHEAMGYCKGKGGGWRLPRVSELEGIFDRSWTLTARCGRRTCKVSPSFRLTGIFFWSSEQREWSSRVWPTYVSAYDGLRGGSRAGDNTNHRALCVRGP